MFFDAIFEKQHHVDFYHHPIVNRKLICYGLDSKKRHQKSVHLALTGYTQVEKSLLMNFKDMLQKQGINPENVIVCRHCPREPGLKKVFPWLVIEKPDIFNAYQQTQSGIKVENAFESLVGYGYVAAFWGHEPSKAVFIGLYSIDSSKTLTSETFMEIPAYKEIEKFGGKRWFTEEFERDRPTVRWFELVLTDFYSHWKGKLIITWPPPERSWWRRAHKNDLLVLSVHEESVLDAKMPEWRDINFTWEELKVLPTRWKQLLSQWRGIYFIFDASDGKAYVGSAYGNSNLLGRWENYAATGHGNNKLLRNRNPDSFQFSILERVSPDMDTNEVIRLESSWKDRLHTRSPSGLNEN